MGTFLCSFYSFSQSSFPSGKVSYWKVKNILKNQLFFLTLENTDSGFFASSRKDALRDFTATPFNGIKNFATVNIEGKMEYRGDTVILEGKYLDVYSSGDFFAKFHNSAFTGYILEGRTKWPITAERVSKIKPLRNYAGIIDHAFGTTKNKIFNPHILNDPKWIKFKADIEKHKHKILDDLELIVIFNIRTTRLPFSHYDLNFNYPNTHNSTGDNNSPSKAFKNVVLEKKTDDTYYLGVRSFNGSFHEIDSLLRILKSNSYKNLIIDLRDNSGGSVEAALPLGSYLSKDTVYAGVLITRNWFKAFKHAPTKNDFRYFTPFTANNLAALMQRLHVEKGLSILFYPDKEYFKGDVYILTNNTTASTCEPIVETFKRIKRATVIGE